MKIALGADHKGYLLKEKVKAFLKEQGHEVVDFGTDSEESTDYPDYGMKVAQAVANDEVDRGITLCWTGNGMNMVVNKLPEIRGAFAFTEEMARLTREHNDSNILSLASKWVEPELAEKIITVWLTTEFEGGRHLPRIRKFSIKK
ncbi:MAG: ribose 5-phosphate isomerase B [candidate division Zixibacteria bacterium]|nr:ribose 5-phosphate isomerase B [candidate division Zixibacteria bacterium]